MACWGCQSRTLYDLTHAPNNALHLYLLLYSLFGFSFFLSFLLSLLSCFLSFMNHQCVLRQVLRRFCVIQRKLRHTTPAKILVAPAVEWAKSMEGSSSNITLRTLRCASCTRLAGHRHLCVITCQSFYLLYLFHKTPAELCQLQQCLASRYDSRVEVPSKPSVYSTFRLSGRIDALYHFGCLRCLFLAFRVSSMPLSFNESLFPSNL